MRKKMTKQEYHLEERLLKNSIFSPSRRLYPPACKPYGLEAEPEAISLSEPCDLRAGGLYCIFLRLKADERIELSSISVTSIKTADKKLM
jgi:hypothetical protein